MRPLALVALVVAALHAGRAVVLFASGYADLGSVFDLATSVLLVVAARALATGRPSFAAVVAVPVIGLKVLEAGHATAHLLAHGPSARHSAALFFAVAMAATIAYAAWRLSRSRRPGLVA